MSSRNDERWLSRLGCGKVVLCPVVVVPCGTPSVPSIPPWIAPAVRRLKTPEEGRFAELVNPSSSPEPDNEEGELTKSSNPSSPSPTTLSLKARSTSPIYPNKAALRPVRLGKAGRGIDEEDKRRSFHVRELTLGLVVVVDVDESCSSPTGTGVGVDGPASIMTVFSLQCAGY